MAALSAPHKDITGHKGPSLLHHHSLLPHQQHYAVLLRSSKLADESNLRCAGDSIAAPRAHPNPTHPNPASCCSAGASSSFLPVAPAACTAVRAVQQQQPPVLQQLTMLQHAAFSRSSNLRGSLLPNPTAQQQQHQQQWQHQQHVRAMSSLPELHSTTILCIRKGTEVC